MSLLENIDFESIEFEIADLIEDALDELVDAAQGDLRKFGLRIAQGVVWASKPGADPRLLRGIKGQARMLAELNRIRLNREAKAVLNNILGIATRVAKSVLTAAVAAV